jgi:4-hydroxyphenylacetate 3-monooxygenase
MTVTTDTPTSDIAELTNSATSAANDVRPMTGAQYLDSLRDDREVYAYGERVKDVTTHPAFRNSTRSIARMYDTFWEPEAEGVLRVPTDTGNGGVTHPFFKTAHCAADLVAARDGGCPERRRFSTAVR